MLKTSTGLSHLPIAGRVVVPPDHAFVPIRFERTGPSHVASVRALRALAESLPKLEIRAISTWETALAGARIFASPRNHHSRSTAAIRIPLDGLDLWARAERVAETLDALVPLDLEQGPPVFALEDSAAAEALAAARFRERSERMAAALGLPIAQILLSPEPRIQVLGLNEVLVEVSGQISLGQGAERALQWAS